jgi:16S rRNA processing protein RimM
MEISECYKIGYVAKTHGLKGEVTIVLGQECPDLKSIKTIFVERTGQLIPYFIDTISLKGDKAFLKLEDVNSAEGAQALKGSSLFLPLKERPKLARGEFYNDEVIGFEVVDDTKGTLGHVEAVFEQGPNRHLILNQNTKEIMIPVNGPFITGINKTKKRISVNLPEGFLDI